MYATIPVYYPSLEEAARKDEAALWCDSYNINMSCRNFIQDKAMTAFNTRELDAFIEELYFLNKDWYDVLVNTGFGKGILAVCLLVLLISFAAVIRLTKPVEYKR